MNWAVVRLWATATAGIQPSSRPWLAAAGRPPRRVTPSLPRRATCSSLTGTGRSPSTRSPPSRREQAHRVHHGCERSSSGPAFPLRRADGARGHSRSVLHHRGDKASRSCEHHAPDASPARPLRGAQLARGEPDRDSWPRSRVPAPMNSCPVSGTSQRPARSAHGRKPDGRLGQQRPVAAASTGSSSFSSMTFLLRPRCQMCGSATRQNAAETDTEGDHAPGLSIALGACSPLRWPARPADRSRRRLR
jgi:hypothetical protein